MKSLLYLTYNVFITLAVPFIWIAAYFNDKLGGSLNGQKSLQSNVLSFNKSIQDRPKPVIWTHAASAGEFEQLRPVLARLASLDVYIYQTFTSATIYYKASQDKVFDGVSFLPWDLFFKVDRFVTLLKPDLFINTRHDIWPNLLLVMQRHGVRNILINANLYPKSRRLLPGARQVNRVIFDQISQVYTGSNDLAGLLKQIYSGPVSVVGDTRFDQVHERAKINQNVLISEKYITDCRVIIYGSVGNSDLRVITSAISNTLTDKAFRHIIVPHETSERDLIPWQTELFRQNIRSIRKSELDQFDDEPVIIWDSVGQLADLYKYATLAFIGAGFGAGVHSVTEAAIYHVPSAHGPKFDILAEATELVEEGLSTVVNSSDELSDFLTQPEETIVELSKRIEIFVNSRVGASDRIMSSDPILRSLTQREN